MKNNKARDAHGHVYEPFKFGGKDLKDSMVRMFNIIKKKKKEYPDIFKPSNITSLYKKKGEKADLNNDRGIFNIVKIRSILDRLVYNDKYSIIDSHMSPSNIGGRKNRNIRDHLFVINSILHDFKQNKKENIDIEIYDAGVKDDTFILVSNSNKSCKIAVKTPWGSVTPRVELENIEMQGGVLTPLKCSVQMDTLGGKCLNSIETSKILYKYKDFVNIPPLEFIDHVLTITKCSINSLKMNAIVQSKIECKRLELSDTKFSKCILVRIPVTVQTCK
jgi:6-pyruvoyl-tetrahydropterin synthase